MEAKNGDAQQPLEPQAPKKPYAADNADPGEMDAVKARQRTIKEGKYGSSTIAPFKPVAGPEAEEKKLHWIAIKLVDQDNKPVAGERYRIYMPDGHPEEGTLGHDGKARIDGIPEAGMCKVTFPDLHPKSWDPK